MLWCLQYVSIYAAYLYDAVMLYAQALDMLLQKYDVVTQDILKNVSSNGTLIIEKLKNQTYESECMVLLSSWVWHRLKHPSIGNLKVYLKVEPNDFQSGNPVIVLETQCQFSSLCEGRVYPSEPT